MELKRTFDFLLYQQEKYPLKNSLNYKVGDKWNSVSTEQFIKVANQLSFGMLKSGVKKGDKVAIISGNRPEWAFVDIAVQQIGAVLVPLYPNIRVDDYQYIFDQAQVKLIFVSDEEIYHKVVQACGIDNASSIFSFDDLDMCASWKKLRLSYTDKHLEILEKKRAEVSTDDLMTIIYTSGTTGFPKGVMLTHANLVFMTLASDKVTEVKKGAYNGFSFLPLNHIFERSALYYNYYAVSSRV